MHTEVVFLSENLQYHSYLFWVCDYRNKLSFGFITSRQHAYLFRIPKQPKAHTLKTHGPSETVIPFFLNCGCRNKLSVGFITSGEHTYLCRKVCNDLLISPPFSWNDREFPPVAVAGFVLELALQLVGLYEEITEKGKMV